MQHHVKNRTLGRTRRGRSALLRGLAISLLTEGKIKTTLAKAQELRPFVERLITTAKEDTVASRRIVASRLGEPDAEVVRKLFNETAKTYTERAGGYTRIIKMGRTLAGRDEAVIELV
jgi:large subunit ribosomal protein L17